MLAVGVCSVNLVLVGRVWVEARYFGVSTRSLSWIVLGVGLVVFAWAILSIAFWLYQSQRWLSPEAHLSLFQAGEAFLLLSVAGLVTVFFMKSWIDPRLKKLLAIGDEAELRVLKSLYYQYEVIGLIPGFAEPKREVEENDGYLDTDSYHSSGYRRRWGYYGSSNSNRSGVGKALGGLVLILIPILAVLSAVAIQRAQTRKHSSQMAYHLEKEYDV